MQLTLAEDPHALLAEAKAVFAARECEHNLALGILSAVTRGLYREPAPWLWSVRDGAQLMALAVRTPPLPLLLTYVPEAGIAPLVDAIVSRAEWPMPLNGPEVVVARVLAVLAERMAIEAETVRRLRLFELRRVIPARAVRGAMRRAEERDRALLVELLDAFQREALPEETTSHAQQLTERMLANGSAFLWEVRDEVVALGVYGRRVGNGASIGPVYTPPAARRRGYATALVAALSEWLLDDGCRYTCLFTDLANPDSNSIYPKVGYRAVTDLHNVLVHAR